VTTLAYDALNRPTSKAYTTGSAALATPTVNYYYDNQSLPSGAPSYSRGSSLGRLVATTHGGGSEGNYFSYDALGRVVEKWQRTGTTNYRVQANYDLAGAMTWQKYPSNNEVNYSFDAAGRLSSFSGKLGGTPNPVTYADQISYSAAGQMKRERFGTANNGGAGLFHRRHYNKRHQLYDIRLGTSDSTLLDGENPNDWQYATGGWDRGALRLFYTSDLSDYSTSPTGANNNGNLYRADHFMPANEALTDWAMSVQGYTYDDLNRLKSVAESAQLPAGANPDHLKQTFSYDRWGNRTIDGANTWAKDGTVWVEDGLPTGATTGSEGGDGWTWVTSSPTAFSGTSSHQSNIYSGQHQHFFYGASQTLSVATGDKLYAWVYLDPQNPPSEIVLQWNNGDWEHRAYWGANLITYWGVDGTDSRRYMGPLPEAGRWVRLEVPASSVGLEGSTLNGMAFSLYGGRATWDRAGKTTVAGGGVHDRQYQAQATTNRLKAPGDSPTVEGANDLMKYDAAGNLSYDGYTNSSLGNHKYDAENKLREVYTGLGSLTAQYFYDGEGQRVRRIVGSTETWQVYGIGGELLAEYPATTPTTVQKEYGYRAGQLLVTAEPGGSVKWVVQDHLGSTRMVVDKSGRLTDDTATATVNEALSRIDYLPFGEEVGLGVGAARSSTYNFGSSGVRQRFSSKEQDPETGLDYFINRYHSTTQGRFISPDLPFADQHEEDPQSWNLYTYTRNNPLRYTDPNGRGIGEFFERLGNFVANGLWMTDQEIRVEAARAADEISKRFVLIDQAGNQHPYDTSGLTNVQVIQLRDQLVQDFNDGKIKVLDTINPTAPPVSPPTAGGLGPSGRVSTQKYLENNWDKATFGSVKKSIEYHVRKHGKGLSAVEYTQKAMRAFKDNGAVREATTDLLGRKAIKVASQEGTGLFTPSGKIIWFHPKL
jgi:RHS repeat-associated protein